MVDYDKLLNFLIKVDKTFEVPLSNKVNLCDFAKKILERADIFYEEVDGKIVSAVIGYTNNVVDNIGYIAVVATIKEFQGNGLAKKLVLKFLDRAKEKNLLGVNLYTVENIKPFYTSLGFSDYKIENETRPNDVHLIFLFN